MWNDFGAVMLWTFLAMLGLSGLGAFVGIIVARVRLRRFMKTFKES